MKQILTLQNEYIIETKFIADTVKNEKTGYHDPAYTDETKKKATGRQNVEHVILMVEILNNDGYYTQVFQKVWLSKDDILKIAEKVKEIDAIRCEGTPNDDLPF